MYFRLDFLYFFAETEAASTWDPTAKAEKSIMRVIKPQSDKKSVKFDVRESDTESDPFEDQFSDMEYENLEYSDEENIDEGNSSFGQEDNENNEEIDCIDKDDLRFLEKNSKKRKSDNADSDLKEDIYGRLRDKKGNIVQADKAGSYIPPAKRFMMAGSQANEQLRKKLKGLLNK